MEIDVEKELLARFLQWIEFCGGEVEASTLEPVKMGGMDGIASVRFGKGKSIRLFLCFRSTVYPRDVPHIRFLKSTAMSAYGKTPYYMVVANMVSDGARAALRDAGIGYFDNSGSGWILHQGVSLFHDFPAPKKQLAKESRLFDGKSADVLYAMYQESIFQKPLSVVPLATKAGVSPALVSNVLQRLEEREWVRSKGNGPFKVRILSNPGALLDAWVAALPEPDTEDHMRFYVPPKSSNEQLAALLCKHRDSIVASHVSFEVAGNLYAPLLTKVPVLRIRTQVSGMEFMRRSTIELAQGKQVSEGWNLELIPSERPSDFIFDATYDNLCLASPIRVYLDLMQTTGRAPELAAHLREQEFHC